MIQESTAGHYTHAQGTGLRIVPCPALLLLLMPISEQCNTKEASEGRTCAGEASRQWRSAEQGEAIHASSGAALGCGLWSSLLWEQGGHGLPDPRKQHLPLP